MYDLFIACSDLFPILDFFIKSKLILGLFGKELFGCATFFCLFFILLNAQCFWDESELFQKQ